MFCHTLRLLAVWPNPTQTPTRMHALFSTIVYPRFEPLPLTKCQNAVDFRYDETMLDIKLQISVMAHIFLFIHEIWDKLLRRFPVFISKVTFRQSEIINEDLVMVRGAKRLSP